jgi:hypothetical protein
VNHPRLTAARETARHLARLTGEAFTKNWGLKLLALLLALVIYHTLKPASGHAPENSHDDKRIFDYR